MLLRSAYTPPAPMAAIITVTPTIQGIRLRKDEALEKALEVLGASSN